jgi:hypothetical protein
MKFYILAGQKYILANKTRISHNPFKVLLVEWSSMSQEIVQEILEEAVQCYRSRMLDYALLSHE